MDLAERSKEELIEEVQRLQRQVEDAKRVTQERTNTFNEAEERYRSLFEAAFEGLTMHDQGEIVDANPMFCTIFGYELDELVGDTVWKLVHPDYHDAVRNSIETRNEAPYEFVGLHRDGRPLALEVIAKHHLYRGRMVRVAAVRDLSLVKEFEMERIERQRLSEALADSSAAINSSLDPNTVMKRILENVEKVVPHDTANIMLLTDGIARMGFWQGYEQEYVDAFASFEFDVTQFATLRHMMETGEPIVISDTDQEPNWMTSIRSYNVRSYAGAPIQLEGEIIGFLNVDCNDPNKLNEQHAARLQAFARHAASAIRNARLYATVKQAEAENRAMLDVLPDMIVRFNREGRYLDAQGPPESSIPASDIIGQTLADLLPEDIARVGEAQIRLTFDTHEMQVHEYQLPGTQANDMIEYEARLVVLSENEVLGIIRDITERKRAEQALAEARDEALEASRVKSQFLANISHELRTPLNSILNYVELLMDGMYGELSEKQQDRLEKVLRNAGNLLELINDVLDLSKIQAGQMELHTAPVQSDAFLQSVVEVYKPLAEQKGLSLDYLPSEHAAILIDETRARQVVTNLIGNAIKFTSEGRITVTSERDANMLWLAITDTGIGIPQEAVATIFDEFRQVDASYTRQYEGTGLGLTISRNIVEMHGGQIAVESEVDVGSTFRVSFPIAKGKK